MSPMKDSDLAAKIQQIAKPEHVERLEKLARPDYVVLNPSGYTLAIFCKICGEGIAGLSPENFKFIRYANYVEVKMTFGHKKHGAHVTNLCSACATKHQGDKEMMLAVFTADILQMAAESASILSVLDDRGDPKVRTVDGSQKGLK